MLEAIPSVLTEIFTGFSLLYLIFGAILGIIFGILPGLGGPQVLVLLLPVTIGMDTSDALLMLIGASGAVPLGGSLTSILLNTPGTPQNAATVFDGYPLTKQGKAGEAIGAALAASLLGAVVGVIALTLILPVGSQIVLAFSYPEYFMLAFMGLCMISALSEGSLWKSLIACSIGLMLAFVGLDPVVGATRYTFGIDYLWDGIKLVPVLIGLFAIAESVDQLMSRKGGLLTQEVKASYTSIFNGVKAVFLHFNLFMRSSLVGVFVGLIPGVGGSIANFMAYGQAVASSKNPETFGKGDIRGVIAPESANNAKDGGSLVPTLIFGIPGNLDMAVLLGAFVIHGIQPGPRMITDNPDVILVLIYGLLIANVIVTLFVLFTAIPLVKITRIKATYIAPVILVLAIIGAYATNGVIGDVIVALIFGLVGYIMKLYGYSRVALIIALVLGAMVQQYYQQTIIVFGGSSFFTRPISLICFIIAIFILFAPFIKSKLNARKNSDITLTK
ncbi:tripartite tricarboxylate transporter permease [Halalkalibacterium ligniniphilum]|uniref:tripartite tricarboxylate transporter permease n=1 Tax=Halalkalibacterium ligniniphilum TaxID=1134413 RepID=UPI0003462F47|nr:tripartite tricarboxylate transporter permease [Halalkalibacterium ligniniphilum]